MKRRALAYRHAAAQTVYDFLGYDIKNLYTPFKTNLHQTNTCFWVSNNFLGSFHKTEFDSNGLISVDSPCEGFDDLGDYLSSYSAYNIYHRSIAEGSQSNNEINKITDGGHSSNKITDGSGNLLTKNGKFAFQFQGGGMKGDALSVLDDGNNYSIVVVTSNDVTSGRAAILNSTLSLGDRVTMFCDRSTTKSHTLIKGSSTDYYVDLSSQINSSDSRIMFLTVNGTSKEIKTYIGSTLQSTDTYTGSYNNDKFRIAENLNGVTPLTGTIQGILIADAVWDGAAVSELNTKLVNIFGL